MKRPALIFDFGNVVAHFDYRKASAKLGRHLGLSGEAFLEMMRPLGFSPLVRRYETGQLSSEEFSAEFLSVAGLDIPHAEFAAAWADIFWLNVPVAALIRSLKLRGYRLVLGSNTNELHATGFRVQFADLLGQFDRLVLSYEVGHAKPSAEFYQACVEAANVPAEASVFIDDLPENVEGARSAGLIGLLYQDEPTLRADLRGLGVEIAEI
jgi:FMN phosphatase YigB (HAD superfamily)